MSGPALAGALAWGLLVGPAGLAGAAGPAPPMGTAPPTRSAPAIPGARPLHVEPSPELVRRAEALRAEAEDLRSRLAATRGAEASILEEARRLDQQLALSRAEAGRARAEAEIEDVRAARAGARAEALRARADGLRRRVALIARALHARGPDEPIRRLLGGEGEADPGAAVVVAERQGEAVRELTSATAAAVAAAREARSRAAAAAALRREAETRAADLERDAARRQAALRRLADAARRDGTAVADKERAARELLDALSTPSLARSREQPGPPPQRRPGLVLAGLRAREGTLGWPLDARARVLEPFGSVRDPRRGTRTFRHGVALAAERGARIRAVADGRVAFVDWYKGFGRCVVVDHGQGDMSVVAHADEVLVRPGDEVAEGDAVATVGDTGSLDGPRLWFQIQVAGESRDPLRWLRP